MTKWQQSASPGTRSAGQFEHLLKWRMVLQAISGSCKCPLQIFFSLARHFVIFRSHLSIVGNLIVKDVLIHPFLLSERKDTSLVSHEGEPKIQNIQQMLDYGSLATVHSH